MCGINGIIYKSSSGEYPQVDQLNAMNNMIVHRGPDDFGTYLTSCFDKGIAMGMRRLSVIDLATGSQPILNEDESVVIVFNGEIYNYLELREGLRKEGVKFTTNSDTEVILRLYENKGCSSFSLLDGMFAFSILDKSKGKIYLVRDFFGEKPLYYHSSDSAFYWASELKSIIKVLDRKPGISSSALSTYFRLTYIPAPFTIYEGIYKLRPNSILEYDLKTKEIIFSEMEREMPGSDIALPFEEAVEECFTRVFESVRSRSVADVPLGAFLSGGVDSSVVSWCLAQQLGKIDTFSIGFRKKEFDESDKAKTVAKLINSNHHLLVIDEQDLFENIERILLNFDEPFADSSALASFQVANYAKNNVKVALTGDGGDEVFGGYNKYYIGKMNNIISSVVPHGLFQVGSKILKPLLYTQSDKRGKRYKLRRLLDSIDYDSEAYYKIISLGFTPAEIENILISYQEDEFDQIGKIKVSGKDMLKVFREIDRHFSLEGDMLVKVDRTSMLASLECRAPLLNKKLWEFTNRLPDNYLLKGYNKKYLLKKAFEKYFPKGFLETSKQGFGVPVGDWLRSSLKSELLSYTESAFLREQGLFNPDQIKSLIFRHTDGKHDNTFPAWTYYCFQKWFVHVYEA